MVHYYGIFYNTGQSCEARSRLYVHEDIYDEFVSKFVEKTKKLKLGDPFDKGTHMGAIIDQSQLDVIDGYVQSAIEEGAEILAGGKLRMQKDLKMDSGMSQQSLPM